MQNDEAYGPFGVGIFGAVGFGTTGLAGASGAGTEEAAAGAGACATNECTFPLGTGHELPLVETRDSIAGLVEP